MKQLFTHIAVVMSQRARQIGSWVRVSRLLTLVAALCFVVLTLSADGQTSESCQKTGQGGRKLFCDDFNSHWEPQGGVWMVEENEYVGEGTFDNFCTYGFSNNETLIQDLDATNVDIQLHMRSIERVDKGIILRSTGPGNQIELDFRAERPGAYPADLLVQELVNCQFIRHTQEFEVLIPPHQVGQTIHVRITLIGNRLQVWIDAHLVLDRSFSFVATKGQVGLAVINAGITAFDNVSVKVLK
jgi:hypothetical protein